MLSKKCFKLFLISLTICVTKVIAGEYEDGVLNYQNKNYETALQKFRISASQANINSYIYLGLMYENGFGVEKNFSESLKYYKLASDQNNSFGQNNLASLYLRGLGVEKNSAEALRLFKLSASQGNLFATNNLGNMYKNGDGIEKNINEAIRYYKVSAEKGNLVAQTNLGFIYVKGDVGVEKNFTEAFKYFKLAADKGNPDAQTNLGLMYVRGDGVEKNYPEAIRLFKLATDQGVALAQTSLGMMYLKGEGVEKNYAEALRLLKSASDKNSNAQTSLASMYQNGYGVEKDYAEAFRLYSLAAIDGNSHAQNNIGWIFQNGLGVEQDNNKAYVFYKLAEKIGNKESEKYRIAIEKKLTTDEIAKLDKEVYECSIEIRKCINSISNSNFSTASLTSFDKSKNNNEKNNENTANSKILRKRIALVIGNANYPSAQIKNPLNDANDISAVLKQSGFEIIDQRNATLLEMTRAIRLFGDKLQNSDVGLVYYSGHGIEAKGRNYLLPVNISMLREDEIGFQALDVNLILEKMNTASKSVNIVIIDACRDNPFTRGFRGISKGLAQIDAPTGTIVAFATSPGKTALDGDGRNSPYTKNLVKQISKSNMQIENIFKEVRKSVVEETKGQQTPWESSSLIGDFYFKVTN